MHGQYIRSADSETIGGENTLLWLVSRDQTDDTESATAARQALQTERHATKLWQTERQQTKALHTTWWDISMPSTGTRTHTVCTELQFNIRRVKR
jgi:hypothetical protein